MKVAPTPFWEQARGGGPITDWVKSQDELAKKAAARAKRLTDPRTQRGLLELKREREVLELRIGHRIRTERPVADEIAED